MGLTILDIYNVRFEPKLSLPRTLQENIAKLRITPAVYKPVRTFAKKYNRHHAPRPTADSSEDWREKALEDNVKRVHERKDPEYSDIFSIFNKLVVSNLDKLSHDALEIMKKQDEKFRLRVTTLLFDKAITQSAISSTLSNVLAECAFRLNTEIPEVSEDLELQFALFPKLYDMSNTLTFPETGEENYDDKVIAWNTQKLKRSGYTKFMVELYTKDVIKDTIIKQALDRVITDMNSIAKLPKKEQNEENVAQFADFILQISKILKADLKQQLKESLDLIFSVPKEEFKTTYPSMHMKSKWKLEDALKELNNKE
jgi:hypothetical protein